MTFGSCFTGCGTFDYALERAGLKNVWQCEIDKHCTKVLSRHWRDTPRATDIRELHATTEFVRPELICGGWPCQGNSVAGKRAGMVDGRSGLWGELKRVIGEFRPTWFLGENVPGILSVNGGQDWLTVLRDLAELGYGFAYRILDAKWFGVPQRRRRVFLVGHIRDWRCAARVLFESEGVSWNPQTRREPQKEIAGSVVARTCQSIGADDAANGHLTVWPAQTACTLNAHFGTKQGLENQHIDGGGSYSYPPKLSMCLNAGSMNRRDSETETMIPIMGGCFDDFAPVGFNWQSGGSAARISARDSHFDAIGTCQTPEVHTRTGVRRLTPRECERLQGLPDDFTRWGVDGGEISNAQRYKMVGNGGAAPCLEWIGRRILKVSQSV